MLNWRYMISASGMIVVVVAYFAVMTPDRESVEARALARQGQVEWSTVKNDPLVTHDLVWSFAGKAESGVWPQRLIEERFNIRLTPRMIVSGESYQTKLPMQLAAGDVPDVFNPGNSTMLRVYARHGFLLPLPLSMLNEHAPHLVALVNRYAPEAWSATTYDGVNYGLPTIWYDGLHPRTPIWRKDWLENVGIERTPETLEEMEEALRRFRNDDPDGNGRRDTYGMSGDLMNYYTTFSEVFGAYGVLPFGWMVVDGQVVWGGVLPETREALALLRRWYDQELIHPDFVTDRWYAEIGRKLYSGRIGYHNYLASYEAFDPDNPQSALAMMRRLQPEAELIPGVPPRGPAGRRGMRVWGAGNAAPVVFGAHMADRPEAVVRVLRMLDEIASDTDLYIETRVGRHGQHWDWADTSIGPGSGAAFMPPLDQAMVREREGFNAEIMLAGASPFAPIGADPDRYLPYMPQALVEFRERNRKIQWGLRDVFGSPGNVPGVQSSINGLIQLQQTAFAKIIRGEEPLDYFNTFVEEWHRQGGAVGLELAQDHWRKQRRVLEEMGSP